MTKIHTYQVTHGGQDFDISAAVNRRGSEWVLCLHGIQSNKELFDDLFQQPFLSDFSLMAPDFVGFGGSAKPLNFSYDVQDQAKIIEKLILAMDIQHLHIIGHSLGGMVGTMLLEPLATIVRSFVNMEGNLVLEDCGLSLDVSLQSLTKFLNNQEFESIKSELRKSNQPGSFERARWLDDVPDFAFHSTCASIVRWSTHGELLRMFVESECRKLFVYGSENACKMRIIPSSIARLEIRNSGHFMLQSNREASYKGIQKFLLEQ